MFVNKILCIYMWIMPKIESKNRSEKNHFVKYYAGKRCEEGGEKSAKKDEKGFTKRGEACRIHPRCSRERQS